ncbi:Tn3 family transposase [Yokenella regensburgei]|uniref:Tn3 family transposase n=1 Tax=Yokenella regensburgei TaxID=158877 RepID=UPI003ED9AB66
MDVIEQPLSRAIFLHQLGELRNRAAEAMAYRASGLNLVVNAIVLWNTVYLSRVVDYVRNQGIITYKRTLQLCYYSITSHNKDYVK